MDSVSSKRAVVNRFMDRIRSGGQILAEYGLIPLTLFF